MEYSFITIQEPSEEKGYYIITPNKGYNSFRITFYEKPNWFNRLCCKLLLGWTWEDKK